MYFTNLVCFSVHIVTHNLSFGLIDVSAVLETFIFSEVNGEDATKVVVGMY